MSTDEMKSNVEILSRLTANLEAARDELERLNEEEALFKWELSEFPQLQQMFSLKEPYEKLWNTAWTFHQKNDEWMNGMNWFYHSKFSSSKKKPKKNVIEIVLLPFPTQRFSSLLFQRFMVFVLHHVNLKFVQVHSWFLSWKIKEGKSRLT